MAAKEHKERKDGLIPKRNATYLLKWNPKVFVWSDLAEVVEQVRRQGFVKMFWSCGNTKRIKRGDRVFLLRATVLPRGIVASGIVINGPRKRQGGLYVEVHFDTLLNPENECVLPWEKLQTRNLENGPWNIQGSGKTIPPKITAALELEWREFLEWRKQLSVTLPEEISAPKNYYEGAVQRITVDKYERNPEARRRCILHYGCSCSVCGFRFETRYGELGAGYIHVHHLKPLGSIQEEYEINPVKDMRPVCPNCHAMIHRDSEILTVEDLKRLIRKRKQI